MSPQRMRRDHATRPTALEGETDVFRRLVAALDKADIGFVHTHHPPVFTSTDAASARGTSLHSGAKALILKGGEDFRMAVMPADMSLDSSAFRKLMGSKRLRFATKEEVYALTSLMPGSIPPFGSLFGLETLCDIHLGENDRINFNAGSHTESLQMTYEAYLSFESPRIAQFAKAGGPG